MKTLSALLGAATLLTMPLSLNKIEACPPILYSAPHAHVYATPAHVHTRACPAGPHYIPGEPVRNTLKFLFCPRCHRQYPVGSRCSCGHMHVHVTPMPSYVAPVHVMPAPVMHVTVPSFHSYTTTTTTTIVSPVRQIYFSLP